METMVAAPQVASPRPHVTRCTDGHVIGHCGAVVFNVSCKAQTLDNLNHVSNLCAEMAERYPEGYVYMVVVTPGTPMAPPEVREGIKRLTHQHEDHIRAMALVIEGDGIWASSMRMLANTLMLMVPVKSSPRRLLGNVQEAMRWIPEAWPEVRDLYPEQLVGLPARLDTCPRCVDCPGQGR